MAPEKTYNRDAKNKLLHGITRRQDTISKYLGALPTSEKILEMAHLNKDFNSPEKSIAENDLNQVEKSKSVIVDSMVNPFLICSESLMNISSAETPQNVELIDTREKSIDAQKNG